jgi:arginyl-tRNA synthetase
LYATTDLAAIRYRTQTLGADRVVYVVDARQRDHFKDLFDAARLIGWDKTPDGQQVEFVHLPFGSVLGEDKKPLKTRSGTNVTLQALLEEAIVKGTKEVTKRSEDVHSPTHTMNKEELETIGRQIGIGAVKYADLSSDLVRDYVFDMERMVAFEGNTGPYIQYATARITSLLKRGELNEHATIFINEPAERALALQLLQYGSVLHDTMNSLEPHRLCNWLYETTELFSSFYQSCPVLRAENEELKESRFRLASVTGKVLKDGLSILGIEPPEQM